MGRTSKLFRCISCEKPFRNLKALHCLHSLCKECFEGKLKAQENENCDVNGDIIINCPLCSYSTSFDKLDGTKNDWENSAPVQQVIRALYDIEYGLDSAVCVSCRNRGQTTQSMFWCFDCVDHFCTDCQKIHSSFPLLSKHKIYSLGDLKQDPSLVTKATELCGKHNLRFIKLCSEKQSVCCNFCLSLDHIDVCKGEHREIQHEMVSKLVKPKVTELHESFKRMLETLDSQGNETSNVDSEIEKFFKDEQNSADEKSQNLKIKVLESTDSLMADSYKITFYKLQEMETRIIALKQRKFLLENAVDIVSALRGGSEIRNFLEIKKIKQVLKDAAIFLDDGEQGRRNAFSIIFEISLNTFCKLKNFGNIMETRFLSKQENPMCVARSKYGSEMNVSGDLSPAFASSSRWVSELNLSSTQTKDANSTSKNIQFDGRLFTPSKSIKLENGFSHVTGCDWKSNDEIVIVDQKVKGRAELCVYDIQNGNLKRKLPLDQKPYDISVLPNNQCVITFPKEMEFRVYSLTDYSLQKRVSAGIKCYGVCHCMHQSGLITVVAGEDKLALFDKDFNIMKSLNVKGGDIRYVSAYNSNLIFYSDLQNNRVCSVIGNGDTRFDYTNDDKLKGAAGLILDESKNVYVCEKGANNIHVLSKSGIFIRKIEVCSNPTALSVCKNKKKLCIVGGGRHVTNMADIYISM